MTYFVLPPTGVAYVGHDWAIPDGSIFEGFSLSRENANVAVLVALQHFAKQLTAEEAPDDL